MHRAPAFVVGVLVVAAAAGVVAARSSRVAGEVSVRASPPFSIEPGFVDLLIRHVPQKSDRALVVEIESASMFRSSLIPLDGADAPAVHSTRFHSLPRGKYVARVWLERSVDSPVRAETSFRVAGPDDESLSR